MINYARMFYINFLIHKYMYKHLFILIFISIILYGLLYYITKKHKNFKKRKLDTNYYITSYINLIIFFVLILLVYSNKEIFLSQISTISLKNIMFYMIVADAFYYWFHRITHRIPILKKLIHLTHHNSFNLLPLDILYVNSFEFCMNIFIINFLPLLITDVSLIEYISITLILFVHSIYIHSETTYNFVIPLFTTSKSHKYHHQIGGGNYTFLKIWDDYMGTKIKKPKIR